MLTVRFRPIYLQITLLSGFIGIKSMDMRNKMPQLVRLADVFSHSLMKSLYSD